MKIALAYLVFLYYMYCMNIEASIKTLVDALNAKFAYEGSELIVKVRKCRGYVKLTAGTGTIAFIAPTTGVMSWCGNVQHETDRAALIAKVFRGR